MGMFTLGKAEGRREALKELPIVHVQPRQMTARVYLPPGEWTRQYRASHLIVPPVIRTNTAPVDPFPDWLTSGPLKVEHITPDQIAAVPTIRDPAPTFDPDDTNEVPAIMKLYYQERQARHAG